MRSPPFFLAPYSLHFVGSRPGISTPRTVGWFGTVARADGAGPPSRLCTIGGSTAGVPVHGPSPRVSFKQPNPRKKPADRLSGRVFIPDSYPS